MSFDVVVIGSINYDISVFAPRHPRPGETLVGSGHFFGPGGKGANQAVAAARLGACVGMVGRVGRDEWGVSLVEGLAGEGIDVSAVGEDSEAATGVAVITIDAAAENTIVVSPGANMRLTPQHISDCAAMISAATVVLVQLEIPIETVLAVSQVAIGTLILNPAPARVLPRQLLDRIDVLVPNRSELAILGSGEGVSGFDEVASVASELRPSGATVVTLGSEGAMLVQAKEITRFPAFPVDAIDPTGAGDAFCGALAFSLSQGSGLEEAIRLASAAAAISVTEAGAQPGMPRIQDVEALLGV